MAEHLVVCIGRQFGSGGREVGIALAEQLGISFYDKEILERAAAQSGITAEVLEQNDEKPGWGASSGLSGAGQKAATYAEYAAYMPGDRTQGAIEAAIRTAAGQEPCVIMGRCADHILRGRPGTLSVFIHADTEARVRRIQHLHNLDEDSARALVRKTDSSRANYYSYYTARAWGAENYMLALDAGKLGKEATVELLSHAVKLWGGVR